MTNQMDAKQFYARVFTQCLRLADTHTGMRNLVYDSRLGRMATQLAGVEGMRIWHDQALIKPPHGNPTAWHLDVPYWSFDSRDTLSFWMALDDATLANGCMWYLPRTHKTARFDNVGIGVNIGELFTVYPEWKQIEPQAAPCPAGSVVWHNGLTAHGAGANMTLSHRRTMTCGFMPDGCTFNGKRNILPEDYFNSLKIGMCLTMRRRIRLSGTTNGRRKPSYRSICCARAPRSRQPTKMGEFTDYGNKTSEYRFDGR